MLEILSTLLCFVNFYHGASAGASQEVELSFDSHPQAIVGTGEGYPNNNKNKHSSRLIKSFRRIDGELISWHKPVAV